MLAFWLLGLTLVGELFMPLLMHVLAPGFGEDPAKFTLAVTLARITFPLFAADLPDGAAVGRAERGRPVRRRRRRAGAVQRVLDRGHAGADALCAHRGHALAWGVVVAGAAQLALLSWATWRAGMPIRLPRPRLTPAMRLLMRRMGPGLIGASAMQLNQTVDVIIGSLLPPGTIALMYYADRVDQLPLGTIGIAVGTALLPMLSRQVRGPDPAAPITTLNRAIEFALVLTIPAALGLIVAGYPIMVVLFARGAFNLHAAALSSQSLAAYALGLPAFVLVRCWRRPSSPAATPARRCGSA